MLRTEARLSIIGIVGVFTATMVMFIGIANFGTAQGQAADDTSSSPSSLTAEQRAAICDPNNPSSNLNPVNTTESRICGIPKTVQPSISNGTDTGTETPSVLPTPPSEEG
jgi:cell division protein FtsN